MYIHPIYLIILVLIINIIGIIKLSKRVDSKAFINVLIVASYIAIIIIFSITVIILYKI